MRLTTKRSHAAANAIVVAIVLVALVVSGCGPRATPGQRKAEAGAAAAYAARK